MAHSIAFSRGYQYAKSQYHSVDESKKSDVLSRLESEARFPKYKTLFEQGMLSFIKEHKNSNNK